MKTGQYWSVSAAGAAVWLSRRRACPGWPEGRRWAAHRRRRHLIEVDDAVLRYVFVQRRTEGMVLSKG